MYVWSWRHSSDSAARVMVVGAEFHLFFQYYTNGFPPGSPGSSYLPKVTLYEWLCKSVCEWCHVIYHCHRYLVIQIYRMIINYGSFR